MHGVLTILFIVVFIGTMVLLINPKLLPEVEGVPSLKRWQIAVTGLVGIVLLSIFSDSNNPAPVSDIGGADQTVAVTEPAKKENVSLGITLDEFKTSFNAQAKAAELAFNITEIKVDSSQPVHTFNIELSKHQGIVGSVNDSNEITGINSISTGDGSLNSGANMLFLAVCIVNTFNPEGSKEANTKFAVELFKQAADGSDGESHDATIGDMVFTSMRSKSLGFWFSVYPKD